MRKIISIICAACITVVAVFSCSVTVFAKDGVDKPLYALSACLMDAENGRVLYEKDGYKVRAVASTTKIMSGIIALEYGDMESTVKVSDYASKMPDVQMNICAGEEYTLESMVYGMMLESYNDCAVAVAEGVCVTTEQFVKRMNEKAKEIGCTDTHFVTPNGLDGEDAYGPHESTAVDMARIASYAIQNEEFLKIVNTRSKMVAELNGKRTVTLHNRDAFLDKMDGAIGIKTGFTNKAGYCFVGAVKREDRVLVSVVLASSWPPNRNHKWMDTIGLMELGIEKYYRRRVNSKYIREKLSVLGCDEENIVVCNREGIVSCYIDGYKIR